MRVGAPAIVVGAGIAEADIGARAAFDAVVAGELVALEQRGGVEDEALGVLVGNGETADILLVRAHEHLRHRLDDMAGTRSSRTAPASAFRARRSPCSAAKRGTHVVVLDAEIRRHLVDGGERSRGCIDIVGVALQRQQRRQLQAAIGGEGALPFGLGGEAARTRLRCRARVRRLMQACMRIGRVQLGRG